MSQWLVSLAIRGGRLNAQTERCLRFPGSIPFFRGKRD